MVSTLLVAIFAAAPYVLVGTGFLVLLVAFANWLAK